MSDTVTSPTTETTRLVGTSWDADGNDTAQSVLTGTSQKVRALCLTSPDLVVPILFVPGIMGTRLKVKNRDKGSAWFPPENKWDAIVLLLKHLNKSAAERQKLLDPNNTEVDDNGPAHPDESSKDLLAIAEGNTDAERAKWRGWGQLYGLSYGEILSLLENTLALIFDPASQGKQLTATWRSLVMERQDAEKLGAQKAFVPLQENNLRDAADVLYPVHGVGYNWLQSNRSSGQHLAREIERITAHYRGKGKICEKVIVVTHSMGGLVARACSQEPGMADRILGIVHGVMPAIGAPATYKRIRAGFEGAEQVILGRNAAECTAVMANAPGPLELLPTAQYKTKTPQGTRHWLRASHTVLNRQGQQEEQDVFLGDGDPYADIYLNNGTNWWKLVREDLIDPAGRKEREKAEKEGKKLAGDNRKASDFEKFEFNMNAARDLQNFIADKYHANTFAYYAADPKQLAWNEVHWRCDQSLNGDLRSASLAEDDFNGAVQLSIGASGENDTKTQAARNGGEAAGGPMGEVPVVHVAGNIGGRHKFRIQKAQGPGDGTVPEESGAAPTPHVVQIFRHEGKERGFESYDHQNSYKAKLAQASTLYSIIKIAADSEWVQTKLCET